MGRIENTEFSQFILSNACLAVSGWHFSNIYLTQRDQNTEQVWFSNGPRVSNGHYQTPFKNWTKISDVLPSKTRPDFETCHSKVWFLIAFHIRTPKPYAAPSVFIWANEVRFGVHISSKGWCSFPSTFPSLSVTGSFSLVPKNKLYASWHHFGVVLQGGLVIKKQSYYSFTLILNQWLLVLPIILLV